MGLRNVSRISAVTVPLLLGEDGQVVRRQSPQGKARHLTRLRFMSRCGRCLWPVSEASGHKATQEALKIHHAGECIGLPEVNLLAT